MDSNTTNRFNDMKNLPLHWKIIIGMFLGIFFGLGLSFFPIGKIFISNFIKPFGTIFINLLKLIAIPLILASLIKGVSDLKDISKLSNVAGIPKDWKRSVYNKKFSAIKGLTDLIKKVLNISTYAILSYNNEGIIPVNELENILSVYKYTKKEIKYDAFKGSRNLKNRSNKVLEIMYIISKK